MRFAIQNWIHWQVGNESHGCRSSFVLSNEFALCNRIKLADNKYLKIVYQDELSNFAVEFRVRVEYRSQSFSTIHRCDAPHFRKIYPLDSFLSWMLHSLFPVSVISRHGSCLFRCKADWLAAGCFLLIRECLRTKSWPQIMLVINLLEFLVLKNRISSYGEE